ncbi:hypothetical protein BCR36DRAFT_412649 [Piromyces finnis]|uniref:Uncharacterized protein n=1 Tax=Piromyces finnis TaxID=1754191 RepID=A0A1Y1V8J4_9FUNG|nr:hypothetical protein BCR36DRAFT_412649 [Piromyces finnis]|eukprot:ORX49672.1 hypothetical protein BCR36DRAFT_412649 [Piromyces finnis]
MINNLNKCPFIVYLLYQTEVLKIKNNHNLRYYCKNNICVEVERYALPEFVEIPNENGNIKRYISKSFTYNELKYIFYMNGICVSYNTKKKKCQVSLFYKCTSDSQCLTNKCIDGLCIFNEENPTEFCTSIYKFSIIFGRHSYMHCGKAISDICKTDKECGSKSCGLLIIGENENT